MSNFGISGIWKHPATTIPGFLASVLGVLVALGYLDQGTVPTIVSIGAPILIGIVGVLYKGPSNG